MTVFRELCKEPSFPALNGRASEVQAPAYAGEEVFSALVFCPRPSGSASAEVGICFSEARGFSPMKILTSVDGNF